MRNRHDHLRPVSNHRLAVSPFAGLTRTETLMHADVRNGWKADIAPPLVLAFPPATESTDPSAFRLPAVNGPFVVVLDFVSNRTTEGVRAWPESKPLLDQAAGQRIEFRNAART